jgi:hypothetical protein
VCHRLQGHTHIFLLLPATSVRGKGITGADLGHCSWKVQTLSCLLSPVLRVFFFLPSRCVYQILYTRHTLRQDAIITITLYLATRPKHVAKYHLILIIASCLDVCCLLTVHNLLYKTYAFFIN